MSIEISHGTEARLTDEARRQGVSVAEPGVLEANVLVYALNADAPQHEACSLCSKQPATLR